MAITDEPMLPRLDRLDNLLRHLEEIRGSRNRLSKSSSGSTPSSGALTSDGVPVSSTASDFSRPIEDAILEAEHKGNLIQRVSLLEVRVLKLVEEVEAEMKRQQEEEAQRQRNTEEGKGVDEVEKGCRRRRRKGLRDLVRSCVRGGERKSERR